MQADLRSLLLADAGLSALVGSRVTWTMRPQATALPAVVLTIISEVRPYTYAGEVALYETRVQADTYAASAYVARDVDRALAETVSGFKGDVGGTVFDGIFIVSRFDAIEEPGAGSAPVHRISRDLMIHHKPA